ncbi:MAG: exonuclease domain-containing protein [Lachnospiraceae bacterium]|nr:exonuclease domain-containing protein [Lachnospiraceae bacterium]
MKYVVLDLEMCRVPKKLMTDKYRYNMETIQIGAVLLDEEYNVEKKFSTFIHPEYGRMDSFIEQLTGITRKNVYDAPYFKEALESFVHWLPEEDVSCVSWSKTDRDQIINEMQAKGIENAVISSLAGSWIDSQELFGDKMNTDRQYNLEEALIASDICTEGRAHDGLVDAYNTALLFAKFMKDPNYKLNDIYTMARVEEVDHLSVSMGDMFKRFNLQLVVL